MSKVTIKGHGLTSGVAEGEALVTSEPFGFAHGIEPATGEITDTVHEWRGKKVAGKVLVFPYSKGSSTGGVFALQSAKMGNAPAAVITLKADPVTAIGFIMADVFYGKKIPLVDQLEQNPLKVIKTGDWVKVDATKGIVEVSQKH